MVDDQIPRIIHQTYKNKKIPKQWREYHKKWRQLHPQFIHKLWTDKDNEQLITNYFPWLLDTYKSFPHFINRVDCARIARLYKDGGIYADLDVEPKHNIDLLIEHLEKYKEIGIGYCPGCDFEFAFVATPPRHKFWLHILKSYQPNLKKFSKEVMKYYAPDMYVINLTGPEFIKECALTYQDTLQIHRINLDWDQFKKEKRYLVHHNTGSWANSLSFRFTLKTQKLYHTHFHVKHSTAINMAITTTVIFIILIILVMVLIFYFFYKYYFKNLLS